MEDRQPPAESWGETSSPADAAPIQSIHPLTRLWRVIVSPARAFLNLERDRFSWIAPTIVLAILIWAPSQFPTIRSMQIERQREQLEKIIDRGVMPADQGEKMLARLDAEREVGIGKRLGQLGLAMVTLPVFRFFLPALLLWIGVRYIMEGQARFLAVVNVMAFSAAPAGLREILRAPLQLSKGDLGVHFSPAALTGTESVGGYALDTIDLFDAWILVLLVIGIARVGGLSRNRAAGLVLPLWAVYTLLKIAYRASPFFVGV